MGATETYLEKVVVREHGTTRTLINGVKSDTESIITTLGGMGDLATSSALAVTDSKVVSVGSIATVIDGKVDTIITDLVTAGDEITAILEDTADMQPKLSSVAVTIDGIAADYANEAYVDAAGASVVTAVNANTNDQLTTVLGAVESIQGNVDHSLFIPSTIERPTSPATKDLTMWLYNYGPDGALKDAKTDSVTIEYSLTGSSNPGDWTSLTVTKPASTTGKYYAVMPFTSTSTLGFYYIKASYIEETDGGDVPKEFGRMLELIEYAGVEGIVENAKSSIISAVSDVKTDTETIITALGDAGDQLDNIILDTEDIQSSVTDILADTADMQPKVDSVATAISTMETLYANESTVESVGTVVSSVGVVLSSVSNAIVTIDAATSSILQDTSNIDSIVTVWNAGDGWVTSTVLSTALAGQTSDISTALAGEIGDVITSLGTVDGHVTSVGSVVGSTAQVTDGIATSVVDIQDSVAAVLADTGSIKTTIQGIPDVLFGKNTYNWVAEPITTILDTDFTVSWKNMITTSVSADYVTGSYIIDDERFTGTKTIETCKVAIVGKVTTASSGETAYVLYRVSADTEMVFTNATALTNEILSNADEFEFTRMGNIKTATGMSTLPMKLWYGIKSVGGNEVNLLHSSDFGIDIVYTVS